MAHNDYIIVGGGINSLVCAALLGQKNHRILILERENCLGGCIRTEEVTLPGFRHDLMSCWHPLFTASPAYAELRPALERFGLEYCNTEKPAAVVREDGTYFVLQRSREQNIIAMNSLLRGEGDRYATAMQEFERTLELTFTLLGSELWTWRVLGPLLKAAWRRGPRALLEYGAYSLESARAWLEANFESALVRACIAPWTLHTGYSVESAGSGLMAGLIPFTLEVAGIPVPKGGGVKLVTAFEQLIRSRGGEILVNADVNQIRVQDDTARGVMTADGRKFDARKAVICNVTPTQLYTRLLKQQDVPPSILHQARRFRYGRSDMQIHLALNKPAHWRHPALDSVGLIHLADSIDSVSCAVNEADRGLLPGSGTIAVGQPAVLDPSRTPAGKGMLWIQILDLPHILKGDAAGQIPCPSDGQWNNAVKEAYADRVVNRLEQHIPNLRRNILARAVLSPRDLEALNINLIGGDPYGGACTLDQFLLWRPLRGLSNHKTPVKKLYHIGASTHPGAGLGAGSGYLIGKKLA